MAKEILFRQRKLGCGKQNMDSLQWHCTTNERDVAQLGSAFVLGTKCHGFKSCHPYLSLLLWTVTRGQLRSIKIGHNLPFYDTIHTRCIGGTKRILFLTSVSPIIIKRSQFSSVERGSPKPDVVGSNPTERDFFFLDRIRIKQIHSVTFTTIGI